MTDPHDERGQTAVRSMYDEFLQFQGGADRGRHYMPNGVGPMSDRPHQLQNDFKMTSAGGEKKKKEIAD